MTSIKTLEKLFEMTTENKKLKKVIELLKEYIGLKSVLDFDMYISSLDKSDQDLLEEFLNDKKRIF
jgi:hypothetical protein